MLPISVSQTGAVGVADSVAHAVPGIKSTDILLACFAYVPGSAPVGVDVSEASLGTGTVTLSTTSLAGKRAWFMWSSV